MYFGMAAPGSERSLRVIASYKKMRRWRIGGGNLSGRISTGLILFACLSLVSCSHSGIFTHRSDTEKITQAIGTVNRLQVHIKMPAEKVWPLLMQKSRWIDSVLGEVLVSGNRNEKGAIYRVKTMVEGRKTERIEAVLRSIEPRQYVLMATPVAGDDFATFIDYHLSDTKDGCHVRLNIFMHCKLRLAETYTKEDLPGISEHYEQLIQKKIEQDHLRLKKMLEAFQ